MCMNSYLFKLLIIKDNYLIIYNKTREINNVLFAIVTIKNIVNNDKIMIFKNLEEIVKCWIFKLSVSKIISIK